eukprot:scaffold1665_cov301-Pinguiococcus_pyrenoidosus.AAC.2
MLTTARNPGLLACSDALQVAFIESAETAICDAAGLLDQGGRCRSPASTTIVIGSEGVNCSDFDTSSGRRLRPATQQRRLEVAAEYTSTLTVSKEDAREAGLDVSGDYISTIADAMELSLQEAKDMGAESSFLQSFEAALVDEVNAAGGDIDGYRESDASQLSGIVVLAVFDVEAEGDDDGSENSSGGLTTGAIAGVVLGALVAVALVVGAVILGLRRSKKPNRKHVSHRGWLKPSGGDMNVQYATVDEIEELQQELRVFGDSRSHLGSK